MDKLPLRRATRSAAKVNDITQSSSRIFRLALRLLCFNPNGMTRSADARADLNQLLARFHARKPLRAGSLIVTLFGDALLPRGGSLWLGNLVTIFAAMGIEAGVVRTALSRLAADGLFERSKEGRSAFYHLSGEGRALFSGAQKRIYESGSVGWDGVLRLWFCPEALNADDRALLARQGFGLISGQWIVAAHDSALPLVGRIPALRATAQPADARDVAARAFPLDDLSARYQGFLADYTPLHEALRDAPDFGDLSALVLRTLMIHDYRRIVLRDPRLPAALLPSDWPGLAARAVATALYHRLIGPSERWLDAHGLCGSGALPPPQADLFRRFGGKQD